MAEVSPFRGLRYDPGHAPDLGRILCPPYDVVDAALERRYREQHEYNAIRLELSMGSVADPPAGAGQGDDRYARAAETLWAWREAGILRQEGAAESFYLHEAEFDHQGARRVRRELVGQVRLEPWDRRVVLPHERTYDRPKADRLRLLEATRTNLSPILAFFPRVASTQDALAAAWDWAEARPAAVHGVDLDDVGHRLWVLQDPLLVDGLRRFFEDRPLFIADGHHRYETALRYQERSQAATDSPSDSAGYVMMHLVAQDDPGLVILPIHRLLRGLDWLDAAELEERLSVEFHPEYFPLWPDAPPEQVDAYVAQLESQGQADRVIGMYGPDPDIFAVVSLRDRRGSPASVPVDRDPSWQELDVVLADEAVIRPLLAEGGLQAEDAIDYTRDAHEAFALVRSRERALAVLLNPTRIEQVAAVALAGERMPEKSTYFYPKAPTGLVLRPLD
ncbi:MAG: DUF1015 domain-containing protein [Chloroflexi bacterium]|nr:DUF1015 domain-containing protein [Chloroflexota bacterium]